MSVSVTPTGRNNLLLPLLALGSIVLSCAGVFAAREEFSTYLRTGSYLERAKQITPDMTMGLSSNSMQATLLDCLNLLAHFESLELCFETEETRTALLNKCLAVADEIGARAPTRSLVWFAAASAMLGNTAQLLALTALGPSSGGVTSRNVKR